LASTARGGWAREGLELSDVGNGAGSPNDLGDDKITIVASDCTATRVGSCPMADAGILADDGHRGHIQLLLAEELA
jgi:hypothetical protein